MIEAAEGTTTITFNGKIVTISRKPRAGMSLVGAGDHTIPLASINSIEWKPAGRFSLGHIRFAVAGSQAGAQHTALNRDPNAVHFSRKSQPAFDKLRAAIQVALSQ
jgi:hypothetical protein